MQKNLNRFQISVIIPTFNRSKLLELTLNSLCNQSIKMFDFEVIICDDGSTDDTVEMLEKYANKLNLKYAYQEDKGYRPASARNNGIRLSESNICLFIDSSVLLDFNCLAEHVNFHAAQKYPSVAIGYVYGFDHDEQSDNELRELIDISNITDSIARLHEIKAYRDIREISYLEYNDKVENVPAPWFYFWTCHLSVATSDLNVVGLFDENYDGKWGVEDNDLGFRLHQIGVKICLLRNAKSIHYPHDKIKLEKIIEGRQNRKFFHDKFNTVETELFLNFFDGESTDYIDINKFLQRIND